MKKPSNGQHSKPKRPLGADVPSKCKSCGGSGQRPPRIVAGQLQTGDCGACGGIGRVSR